MPTTAVPAPLVLSSIVRRMLACVLALAAVLVLPGCEQKLTQDNFDAITTGESGMTYDQVVRLLGEGTKDESSGVSLSQYGLPGQAGAKKSTHVIYRWKEDRREIGVTFQDGKAIDKNKFGF